MPYIKPEDRVALYFEPSDTPQNAGELNYILTKISHRYWEDNGKNYQAFNDIIGALEGCKLELYRRKVAPYEDIKIKENGDV
jgi:hypothetical protein